MISFHINNSYNCFIMELYLIVLCVLLRDQQFYLHLPRHKICVIRVCLMISQLIVHVSLHTNEDHFFELIKFRNTFFYPFFYEIK